MCSSSLTMPVCGQSLLGVFATIADPRGRRGRRHDLAGVLAIATAAVCAGASSLVAIAEWAADVGRDLLATSGLLRPGRRVPSESTIRRILQALDADELSAMVGAWLLARDATRWKGRMVVAVDGKTLRGAKTRDMAAPHLLAAVTRGGIVAGDNTSSPRRPARSPPCRFCWNPCQAARSLSPLMRCTPSAPLPAPLPGRVMTTC